MVDPRIVDQLVKLREEFEDGTGEDISFLYINSACLLYDVAKFLGLSKDATALIVGIRAYGRITKGKVLHPKRQTCPFAADCSLTECLMEDCPRFGDRWELISGNGRNGGHNG
jgi:hypothetical protein